MTYLRYHESGYIDMGAVISAPFPIIILTACRGLGKTYGALEHCITEDIRFIYFRRTARILELITDPALHVFKRINSDHGWEIRPELAKGVGRFFEGEKLRGYAAALSTFANVRGFDGSDIELMIYDEFIPERTERRTFDAYTALLNAYETINRNRELEGNKPLKMLLMSNSDLIYSDIIAGLHLGDELHRMQQQGIEELQIGEDILLILPRAEKFSAEKSETVLGRIAGDGYRDIAIRNRFPIEDESRIGKKPLIEYRPVASVKGLTIYRHKSRGDYYVSSRRTGTPKLYEDTEADIRRFLRENPAVWRAQQKRKVFFEGVNVQTVFRDLFS